MSEDPNAARIQQLERRVSIMWCVFIIGAIIAGFHFGIIILNAAMGAR